jgi:predicted nucleotidyltransferase
MPAPRLPEHVAALASELAGLPGAHAVVLGGSRATATHRPDSDWDLGLYYRASVRPLDPADVRALGHPGHVSELGEWGPIVHGGAWLTIEGTPVDVLFADLDTVQRWADDAEHGRFEVLAQNGYVAGAPTYVPVGALALCAPLAGELPRPAYPAALADSASGRWRGRAAVAERREWVVNEKRLVERAGLVAAQPLLAAPGATSADLGHTVTAVSEAIGVDSLQAR